MSAEKDLKLPGKQVFHLVRTGIVTFAFAPPPPESAAEFRKSFNAGFLDDVSTSPADTQTDKKVEA